MFSYLIFAVVAFFAFATTTFSTSATAGEYNARVDQARCSSAEAAAIRDLAFMRRIAVASPHYRERLREYVMDRYVPQHVRLRLEPYYSSSRFIQARKALEVAHNTNFLEINCRRLLAGGNGRAYDRINSDFPTNESSKYFDQFIQIDNEGLSQPFELDVATQGTYLRRMGTIHHEIYHNWSYDHMPHGNDTYSNSMNQVARHALQDSFSQNWLRRNDTPGCPSLRRCRFKGYLLMRDLARENYVAFDPARRGIGLLAFKNLNSFENDRNYLSLQDAALTKNRVFVKTLLGEQRQTIRTPWEPEPTDNVVAISKNSIRGERPPNLNEFIVQTETDFKVVRWGGPADEPNFNVKLIIPFNQNLPVRGTGANSGRSINAGTQFLGYDAFQRDAFFVQTRRTEILNIATETDGAKVRYGIFSGTNLAWVNRTETVNIDGRIRFLGQGKVANRFTSAMLIGTDSKLVLLRSSNTGPRVLATLQAEAWSGPSRWDPDVAQKRPPIFADFDGDGRDEIMLSNDSGIVILKYNRGTLRVVGQMQFGNTFDGSVFSSDISIRKFGKYTYSDDRQAILMWGDGHMRIVAFSGTDLLPAVFSKRGIPFDTGPLRGRTLREARARARSIAGLTLNNTPNLNGLDYKEWVYNPRTDEPVLVRDMTGDDKAEIVFLRRSAANPDEIRAFGILKLTSSFLDLMDYRHTGCFGTEACHLGRFGHWLVRKNDKPLGFMGHQRTGRGLLLVQNRAPDP